MRNGTEEVFVGASGESRLRESATELSFPGNHDGEERQQCLLMSEVLGWAQDALLGVIVDVEVYWTCVANRTQRCCLLGRGKGTP